MPQEIKETNNIVKVITVRTDGLEEIKYIDRETIESNIVKYEWQLEQLTTPINLKLEEYKRLLEIIDK